MTVTLSERFLSLILGAVFGLLTFFIWGIAILAKGGLGAGKSTAGAMYIGLKLSLVLSIFVGLAGFMLGGEKLAHLLGILWGTDREFNEKIDEKIGAIVCSIPSWLAYLVLMLVIVGSYGYLATKY